MARLVVQYPGDSGVVVNGAHAGRTNRVLIVTPGRHVVRLDGEATEPDERTIEVGTTSAADELLHISFAPAPPAVVRTSPLTSRYNGFLFGQCLALAFTDCGRVRYAERRAGLEAFLRDVDVDVSIPAAPGDHGGVTHAGLVSAILPRLAAQSRELAEFAILGALLVQYGLLAQRDVAAAAAMLVEIERLRAAYDLPPIDPPRFVVPADERDPDRALAPSLAYLRAVVDRLPIEADTVFVIAPAAEPYASYDGAFYRPALEHGGYRVLRAWAGLESQDHADLQLALLGRAGLFWADVSELDLRVGYTIGAAHALGKRGMIVGREDRAATLPPTIGHDAVVRYDPHDPEWPHGAVLLMAACLAAIKLAAERGDRLRVPPGRIEGVFDEVSQALGSVLLPPAAREAQRRGRRAMDAGDLALAEASFDEACRLGLDDDETRLWRGWARVGLGRLEDAAADLAAVLGGDPAANPVGEWRPIAAYLRAVLREAQGDLPGALHDFELALALGLVDPEVREKRDAVAARVAS
jgi:hypothetical protein